MGDSRKTWEAIRGLLIDSSKSITLWRKNRKTLIKLQEALDEMLWEDGYVALQENIVNDEGYKPDTQGDVGSEAVGEKRGGIIDTGKTPSTEPSNKYVLKLRGILGEYPKHPWRATRMKKEVETIRDVLVECIDHDGLSNLPDDIALACLRLITCRIKLLEEAFDKNSFIGPEEFYAWKNSSARKIAKYAQKTRVGYVHGLALDSEPKTGSWESDCKIAQGVWDSKTSDQAEKGFETSDVYKPRSNRDSSKGESTQDIIELLVSSVPEKAQRAGLDLSQVVTKDTKE